MIITLPEYDPIERGLYRVNTGMLKIDYLTLLDPVAEWIFPSSYEKLADDALVLVIGGIEGDQDNVAVLVNGKLWRCSWRYLDPV